MAIERWVSTVGNDTTGDGSIGAPYATIARAMVDVVAAGHDANRIYLLPGTYAEGEIDLYNEFAYDGLTIIGIGRVIIDASGHDWAIGNHVSDHIDVVLHNLRITGFDAGCIRVPGQYTLPGIRLNRCLIWQQGAKRNTTYIVYGYNNLGGMNGIYNSTIWGVRMGDCRYFGSPARSTLAAYNCVINTDVSKNLSCYRCAINNTGYVDKSYLGVNDGTFYTETYPAPFNSEDPSTPDLDFDPTHAQFEKYLTEADGDQPIGTPWPCLGWHNSAHSSYYGHLFSARVDDANYAGVGAWANDASFAESGFTPMIVDSSHTLYPDAVTNPSWTCARAISSVVFLGNQIQIKRLRLHFTATGAEYVGASLGESNTIEYRVSDMAFGPTDVSPSWTKIDCRDGLSLISQYKKYVQFRVTLRQ